MLFFYPLRLLGDQTSIFWQIWLLRMGCFLLLRIPVSFSIPQFFYHLSFVSSWIEAVCVLATLFLRAAFPCMAVDHVLVKVVVVVLVEEGLHDSWQLFNLRENRLICNLCNLCSTLFDQNNIMTATLYLIGF